MHKFTTLARVSDVFPAQNVGCTGAMAAVTTSAWREADQPHRGAAAGFGRMLPRGSGRGAPVA
jgi:hypothetical protein